jgi:hypothetical protein
VSTAAVSKDAQAFVAARRDVEAVVQRIGAGTFDLILIDGEGSWDRWVLPSAEAAIAAAAALGVPAHDGWSDDLARRLNRRDEWNTPGGRRRAL